MMYNVAYRYPDLSYIERADIVRLRFWNRGHERLTMAEIQAIENQRRVMNGQ